MAATEHVGAASGEATRIARAIDNAEIQRRLVVLEEAAKKLEDNLTDRRMAALEEADKRLEITQTDRNLRTIAIIFGSMTVFVAFSAILVSVLAWLSKTDAREATRDMQSQAKEATKEMQTKLDEGLKDVQKRFELLAGEALKRPSVQIIWNQAPLDSQVIEVPVNRNLSPMAFSLRTFFLTNNGDRRSEPLSMSLSMMARIGPGFEHQDWEAGPSPDTNYTVSFYSTRANATVAAKQIWNIHSLTLTLQEYTTNIPCKMQVYYGGDKPAEARFQLRIVLQP